MKSDVQVVECEYRYPCLARRAAPAHRAGACLLCAPVMVQVPQWEREQEARETMVRVREARNAAMRIESLRRRSEATRRFRETLEKFAVAACLLGGLGAIAFGRW